MILVAGGVFELVQVAPHLERYQEIFPDEDPTRMARSMIAVGGLSLLVFGIPLVLVMRTAVFMTRFIRTSELPHLVGFARWFRRSLVVLVLWLVFYLVFLLGYAFYVNTGGPS
jgi:hypothetical protein